MTDALVTKIASYKQLNNHVRRLFIKSFVCPVCTLYNQPADCYFPQRETGLVYEHVKNRK